MPIGNNLEPTSYQLTVESMNPKVEPLTVMLDRAFVGGQSVWQAQTMIVVRAEDPIATKTLLAKRLREMADDIDNAQVK